VPPAVDTELGKGSTSDEAQEYRGIPRLRLLRNFESAGKDEYEILVGEAKDLVKGARTNPEQAFLNMNQCDGYIKVNLFILLLLPFQPFRLWL